MENLRTLSSNRIYKRSRFYIREKQLFFAFTQALLQDASPPKNVIMKNVLLTLLLGVCWSFTFGQSFQLQLINNAPSSSTEAGSLFDIYINDSLYESSTALAFRQATPSLAIPALANTRISIANAPSDSVSESFAIFNINDFIANQSYVITINGEFGNGDNPLRLEFVDQLRMSSDNPNQAALRFFQVALCQGHLTFEPMEPKEQQAVAKLFI